MLKSSRWLIAQLATGVTAILVVGGVPVRAVAEPIISRAACTLTFDGCPAMNILPSSLPNVNMSQIVYLATLTPNGGAGPWTFTITAGALPSGLVLSLNGGICCRPSRNPDFPPVTSTFTVRMTDSTGCFTERVYTLVVNGPTVTLQPTLPHGRVGMSYARRVAVGGGTPPYTVALTDGMLPPGLTLSPDGQLSGIPSSAVTTSFVLRATDATGAIGDTFYSMKIVSSHTIPVVPGDFDGDRITDITVFRPDTGVWYALLSSTTYTSMLTVTWGVRGDVPVPADYDGDGKIDFAVYRPGNGVWYVLESHTDYTSMIATSWGLDADVPVPGDYDGDGKTDFAVYRPQSGVWYVLQSSTHYTSMLTETWGIASDRPIPRDYDGDGRTDVAVYRGATGVWYILQSGTATGAACSLGSPHDIPVPSDYDGDGYVDFAVYGLNAWYILTSGNAGAYSVYWGDIPDVPLPADYDGDGLADVAIYRPDNGVWYVRRSSSGTGLPVEWGVDGDVPVRPQP